MADLKQRQRSAYFFLGCRQGGHFEGYSHSAVVLAEGLVDLGWEIRSDVQAWRVEPSGEYTFGGDPIEMTEQADLIVFADDYFFLHGSDRLPELPPMAKAPKLFLDRSDLGEITSWMYKPSFHRLDLILRCHASGFFNYPGNVQPGVFGISHRIAKACESDAAVQRSGAIWGFNHKRYPHSVRLRAEKNVLPLIASRFTINSALDNDNSHLSGYAELMRQQTGGRHFPTYYERLTSALLCSCFGGWFLPAFNQREGGVFSLAGRKLLSKVPIKTGLIAQWDSWRLWEAFAAGAAVLHVDFEQYQFLTGGPLPEPMKHYIPVNINNPSRSLLPILDQPAELARIGEAGRSWALENYCSRAIAARTLQTLNLN